ncbi:hypothetical protein C0991_008233, partial [Blastosporella zonata]
HRDAYKLLFLHRDVSAGNLLIFEHNSGETFGRLIDYDHAKKATKHHLIQRHDPSRQRLVRMNLEEGQEFPVDDDVVSHALSWVKKSPAASEYILATVNGLVQPATSPLSKAALGWDHGNISATSTHIFPCFLTPLFRMKPKSGRIFMIAWPGRTNE